MNTRPTTSIAGAQQRTWSSVGKPVGLAEGFTIPAMCGGYRDQSLNHELEIRIVEVDA